MDLLIKALVGLAVGVLREYLARADLKRAVREEDLIAQLGLENAALRWLAAARADPVRWARLRVQPGAEVFTGGFTADAGAPDAAAPR